MVSERDLWMEAAARDEVTQELRAMVLEADAAVRARRPLCVSQGACCHFERFGHQLWMSGLEVAWCLRQLPTAPRATEIDDAVRRGDCPFLRDGACSVHWARPLGCRAYFCDPKATRWQEDLSERMLARLRALHEVHDVPYRYGEWRTMLAYFAS